MASRETATGLIMFAVGVNLFNVGLQLGNLLGKNSEHAEDRVRDIQTYHEQVYEELEPTYHGLGKLVLNDENDTFEFHIAPEGEKPQTCAGEYKVVDNAATLTGNIACTTTVKAGGN